MQSAPDREALVSRLLQAGAALGWKQDILAGWQAWAATAPLLAGPSPEALQAHVDTTEARLQARRDAGQSGCPTHWQRVLDLPPRGTRARMVDVDGHGMAYKFKYGGIWHILKFLPPFDGRLSARDELGETWVFPSLEHLGMFLSVLHSGRTQGGDV